MCVKYGTYLSIEYLIGDTAGPITQSRADKLNTARYDNFSEGPGLLKVNNMKDKWHKRLYINT